jgi:hypothetical protein
MTCVIYKCKKIHLVLIEHGLYAGCGGEDPVFSD